MSLGVWHIVSIVVTLALIMSLGVLSGRKVKNAADFNTGGKSAGALLVAGTITGTLIGGSSTIGTAELAYNFGLSAWWFTLGAALGCVLLAIIYAKPIRQSDCMTIQEIISTEYGKSAGLITSILTSIGIVLNIVAQILAANALLGSMFGLGALACSIVSIVIMACYVLFGGIKGSGMLGLVKLVLLYATALICGILALNMHGGFGAFSADLPHEEYFNFFARGIGKDLGMGLNVGLGVLSTQTYIQAALIGRSNKDAVRGCLMAAVLCPPVGFFSMLVGMYMHLHFPTMTAAEAFPDFIINYLPAPIAGVALATLLIAVVGTGSGMALGFGTIISNDIYKKFIDPNADGKRILLVSRVIILASLIVSAAFTLGNLGSAILSWGSMSMGLRAVVLLAPMTTALFLPGKIRSMAAILSSFLGVVAMIVGNFFPLPLDSLFLGLFVAVVVLLIDYFIGAKAEAK
jgi:SSS family solute:Na+ symporter